MEYYQLIDYIFRPSDRALKEIGNYAEIFSNIMRKKVKIMQKRRQIMRTILKLIKLFPWLFPVLHTLTSYR